MEGQIVKVIIGKKVWEVSRKMANSIIEMAKQKYKKEGVNAVVAVEKDDVISLLKDTFDNTDALVKAISNWERGGYRCYYSLKQNGGN